MGLLEDVSHVLYIGCALAIPFMFGLVVGRGTKDDCNPADEALGRKVRLAVEGVRFSGRFLSADFQVVYSGQLTVPGDNASYRLQIERRELVGGVA